MDILDDTMVLQEFDVYVAARICLDLDFNMIDYKQHDTWWQLHLGIAITVAFLVAYKFYKVWKVLGEEDRELQELIIEK